MKKNTTNRPRPNTRDSRKRMVVRTAAKAGVVIGKGGAEIASPSNTLSLGGQDFW